MQAQCLAQAKGVAVCAARFRPGYVVFLWSGSEKTWKYSEDRPSDGGWDNLALRMVNELVISKHSVPVFEHSSSWCIDEAKEIRSRNTLKQRARKNISCS